VFQGTDVDPGIAALERAHTLAPGRVDVLLALGGLQMTADRLEEAKASLTEVVRGAEPFYATQARESLAEIAVIQAFQELQKTHDAAKAEAAVRAALPDLDPGRRSAVEQDLARLTAMRTGVVGSLDEIPPPPLESTDLVAHLQYGAQQGRAAQKAKGKEADRLGAEAVQHYRRATEIDATSAEAWLGLAAACARGGCSSKEGERAAETGVGLRPGDPQGTYLLAHYCIEGGQYDRAMEMLVPLLDLDHPMRDEIRFMHVRARVEGAQALIKKGKPAEALKLLDVQPLPEGERGQEAREWIAETKADAELRYWAGRLVTGSEARQAGQTEKARKILEDVVARCPSQDVVKMARQELAAMKVR